MEELLLYVGIDVSSDRLDVAVRPTSEVWQVPYNSPGITTLIERLGELTPQLVVVEATGGMELTLAGELAAAGLPVAVVNPRHVRDFARAGGKLAKTDAFDAHVLAHFAEAIRPAAASSPAQVILWSRHSTTPFVLVSYLEVFQYGATGGDRPYHPWLLETAG